MKNKIITVGVIGLVIFFIGFYIGHKSIVENRAGAVSPAGTSNSNQRMASTVLSLASGSATSTSLLNSDGVDRIVTQDFVSCSNLGTSYGPYTGSNLLSLGLIVAAATTSTNAPAIVTNANNALFTTVATTTASDSFTSSTTWTGGSYLQRWAAGSYMTFYSNATNTAQCTIVLEYINS